MYLSYIRFFSAMFLRQIKIILGSGEMGKKILIVDDSSFMRAFIKKILVRNGYQIAGEAADASEALDKYLQLKPHLVTMDLTMPNMSGIEGVMAIRSLDPQARIIMISAMGQKDMILEAIRAGARDYIVKPFREDQVVQAVERVLSSQQKPPLEVTHRRI